VGKHQWSGPLSAIGSHRSSLAAIDGCWWGILHKTHWRVGALMTPNMYGHGKKKFHWRPLAPLVPGCGLGLKNQGWLRLSISVNYGLQNFPPLLTLTRVMFSADLQPSTLTESQG
jgi:hypothetical protein